MPVEKKDQEIVEGLFKAMQMGPAGQEAMMALFADGATLIEPFSGKTQTHTGKPAIRESFKSMWEDPAPDLTLMIDRVDKDGDIVRAEWTCTSPVFETPMRGYDLFTIAAGKIARLEITVTDMPPMEH